MTTLHSVLATDVGCVRAANQDRAIVEPAFCAVADGMGGHQGGEVAAQIAIETLRSALAGTEATGEKVRQAVRQANQAVWERSLADEQLRGMGTTLTVLALVGAEGDERLALANVGDSRAYLWRAGVLSQVTADHSLVQDLVRAGRITESQAAEHPGRHILTRALGVDSDVDVDLWNFQPMNADRFLLCSDGLVNEVDDERIAQLLGQHPEARQATEALVEAAKANGGNDNITVVIVDVESGAGAPGAGAPGADGAPHPVLSPSPGESGLRSVEHAAPDVRRPPANGDAGMDRSGPKLQAEGASPREGAGSGLGHSPRRITLRVVLFLLVLVLLVVGALGAIVWYDHSSYFVTLRRKKVVIEQGRAGGLLWIQPRTVVRTGLTQSHVLAYRIPSLQQGVQEPSLSAAKRFVANLASEYRSLPLPPGSSPSASSIRSPTTSTTTAVPSSTSTGAG